jgi:rfaE bifunctional protein nucleotidyltransferase chain/domain
LGQIISKEDFVPIREKLKKQNKKIVLCHGVFDLLHYGHIEHFKDARKLGDVLVVSVTAARYVNKGPGRPYFDDNQRMEFLSQIEVIDYVILSEAVTVHEIIKYVQPDIYAKGKEYQKAENDITGNIGSEEAIVKEYGGQIYFTDGQVYSSTKLLNKFFAALPENVVTMSEHLKEKYGSNVMEQVRQYVDDFQNLKVAIVGDVIIDEYVFCNVQGVTMKDASISTFYEYEEKYAGGALAVARHVRNFADNVTLYSMTGYEDETARFIKEKMDGIRLKIVKEKDFVTPIKKRYLKQNVQRQEYDKLFSINHLMRRGERRELDHNPFNDLLARELGDYDVVLVCDFGHGLIDDDCIKVLEDNSKFMCVNCQTNSANMGTNIITKYHRADIFVVDERELRLAFGQALTMKEKLLNKLTTKLGAKSSWVTVGAEGAIGKCDKQLVRCPALTLKVKDTVGAGDAFYSLASLSAATGVPIDIATLIANTAGAIKTNVIGNKESVQKVDMLKFISTILNV